MPGRKLKKWREKWKVNDAWWGSVEYGQPAVKGERHEEVRGAGGRALREGPFHERSAGLREAQGARVSLAGVAAC